MLSAPRPAVSRPCSTPARRVAGIGFLNAGRAMPDFLTIALAACMFLGAVLYTSVGHAGASAYIALMALFGIAPTVMRPTALALNILVASFTAARYLRAGLFRWRTVWPFLLGAVPLAFVGGAIQIPGEYYRPLVGIVLLLGAARLLWPAYLSTNQEPSDPPARSLRCWHRLSFGSHRHGRRSRCRPIYRSMP
jgi:uncharacterized membrane protein YfcA